MALIEIKDNMLIIKMQGIRKIGTLKSEFSIPLNIIKGASVNKKAWEKTPKFGEKELGTDLYGLYFGGLFIQESKRVFYDLKRNESAVVIELKKAGEYQGIKAHAHITSPVYEDFSEIIIGVDSPDETVKLIEEAIQGQKIIQKAATSQVTTFLLLFLPRN